MTLPQGTGQYKTCSAWGNKPDRMGKESRCAFGHIYFGQERENSDLGDEEDVIRLYEGGDFYVRSMESMFEDFKEVYKTEKTDSVVRILEVDDENVDNAGKVLELEEAKSTKDVTKDATKRWPSAYPDEAFKDGVCPSIHEATTQSIEYSSSTSNVPRSLILERSSTDKLSLPGASNTSSTGSVTILNPSNTSSEGSMTFSSDSNTSSQGGVSTSSDSYTFSETSMPSSSKTKTSVKGSKGDLNLTYKHTASELSLLQIMEQIRSRILSDGIEGAGDCVESHTYDKAMPKTLRHSVTNILNIPVESVTQSIWTRLVRLFEFQTDSQGRPLRNFQNLQDYPDNFEEDNIKDDGSEKIAETTSSDCGHSVKIQTASCLESPGFDESLESIHFAATRKAFVTELISKKEIRTSQLFQNNEFRSSVANSGSAVNTDASGLSIRSSRRRDVTNSRFLRVCAALTLLYVAYLFHVHIILAFLMEVFLSDDQMAVFGVLFPIIAVAAFVYFTCFYDLQ